MTVSEGLNPEIRTREIVFEADVQAVTGFGRGAKPPSEELRS